MATIATLTINPAVDKSCTVEQVMAERKLRCDQPKYHPGGGGLNVARAINELGGQVTAYWTCGGAIGELLRQRLDEEGLEHQPIAIQAMTRENLIVYENLSGRQYRFGMPGASLTPNEVEDCLARLQAIDPSPEYLILSGSLPPGVDDDLYAQIAEAMPPDCRIILDTSGQPLVLGMRAPLFLIKPNLHELGELSGQSVEEDVQIQQMARSLIDQKQIQVIVTSLGSGGAVLTTADIHQEIRAPTVKIRSKVGAGDSMVAGIVSALSRGASITEAARFGVAAGSAAVMTEGTTLCRKQDTERLYEQMSAG